MLNFKKILGTITAAAVLASTLITGVWAEDTDLFVKKEYTGIIETAHSQLCSVTDNGDGTYTGRYINPGDDTGGMRVGLTDMLGGTEIPKGYGYAYIEMEFTPGNDYNDLLDLQFSGRRENGTESNGDISRQQYFNNCKFALKAGQTYTLCILVDNTGDNATYAAYLDNVEFTGGVFTWNDGKNQPGKLYSIRQVQLIDARNRKVGNKSVLESAVFSAPKGVIYEAETGCTYDDIYRDSVGKHYLRKVDMPKYDEDLSGIQVYERSNVTMTANADGSYTAVNKGGVTEYALGIQITANESGVNYYDPYAATVTPRFVKFSCTFVPQKLPADARSKLMLQGKYQSGKWSIGGHGDNTNANAVPPMNETGREYKIDVIVDLLRADADGKEVINTKFYVDGVYCGFGVLESAGFSNQPKMGQLIVWVNNLNGAEAGAAEFTLKDPKVTYYNDSFFSNMQQVTDDTFEDGGRSIGVLSAYVDEPDADGNRYLRVRLYGNDAGSNINKTYKPIVAGYETSENGVKTLTYCNVRQYAGFNDNMTGWYKPEKNQNIEIFLWGIDNLVPLSKPFAAKMPAKATE